MSNTNDFRVQYYIDNVPWKRNLSIASIPKFNNLRYEDKIVFHFDFSYSIFNVQKAKFSYFKDKSIFISAINVCLRYYQIIKTIYPYNDIYVIIYTKSNLKLSVSYETLKTVIDLIPRFAICNNENSTAVQDFNTDSYKHIIYGNCGNIHNMLTVKDNVQKWQVRLGKLIIK